MEQEKMRWYNLPLMIAMCVGLCASRVESQTFTTLLSFTGTGGTASGGFPIGSLTLSGTTLYGATHGYSGIVPEVDAGRLFSIGTDGTNYKNLVSFTGTGGTATGAYPKGTLTVSGTTLYGTTQAVVFSVGTDGTSYQKLASFSNGEEPGTSLVLSGSTLYAMTLVGGTNHDGSIFSVSKAGTNFQTLISFTGSGGAKNGNLPRGGLTLSGTTFYGMTSAGGGSQGNIFSVGTNGSNYSNLVSFTGSDGTANGLSPYGDLTLSGTTLYGTTYQGGVNSRGNVFSVGINGTDYHNLLSFTGTSGAVIGQHPLGSLTLSGSTLYGTTWGGSNGTGNIFSVGIDGSNYLDLHDFTGGADGANPNGNLTLSGGTLFGLTPYGGANGYGTVFALTLPTPEPGTLSLIGAMCLAGFAWRRRPRQFVIIIAIALLPSSLARADVFTMPAGQTSLQFVTVGDAGNLADTSSHSGNSTGQGAVAYNYRMGKYDVTLAQYTQFLNAVAATDSYSLYNAGMGAIGFSPFGISQMGSPGSYTYSVTGSVAGQDNMPVPYVSWGDAARFCNWLDNGQGTAASVGQAYALTETGAYSLNGATSNAALMAVAAPAHTGSGAAQYFIPSEDEWYKSAFYKSGGTNAGYWTYATRSDTLPSNVLSSSSTNNVNYDNGGYTDPTEYLTPVGTFASSPGPYGTFDQNGDLFQWNEANLFSVYRGVRGGAWHYDSTALPSTYRNFGSATSENPYWGFRVASSVAVPEPGTLALLGSAGLALSVALARRAAHGARTNDDATIRGAANALDSAKQGCTN
jgi:formylglycine-generating enzyme required for sulfatase activity